MLLIFLACDAIILHNTYRANHNAAPFGIPSAALCQGAQDWADGEAEANENSIGIPSMEHSLPSERPGEGENMAWSSAQSLTLSEATTMWQAEDAYWDFDNHQVKNQKITKNFPKDPEPPKNV